MAKRLALESGASGVLLNPFSHSNTNAKLQPRTMTGTIFVFAHTIRNICCTGKQVVLFLLVIRVFYSAAAHRKHSPIARGALAGLCMGALNAPQANVFDYFQSWKRSHHFFQEQYIYLYIVA